MEIGISSASLYPQLLEDSLQSIGEAGIKKTEIFLNTFSEMSDTFIEKLCEIRDRYCMKNNSAAPFLLQAMSRFFAFSKLSSPRAGRS